MCLAVPGKIVEVSELNGLKMGKVDFGGALREVCLDYVPEARLGDYVIVHVGFAISILSESEAKATLDLLQEIAGKDPGVEAGAGPA